jgi:hypothetical protein
MLTGVSGGSKTLQNAVIFLIMVHRRSLMFARVVVKPS